MTKRGLMEKTSNDSESEAAMGVLEVPTPLEDETIQAQETNQIQSFGLIVKANGSNDRIIYASNERVLELVHFLLNKRPQKPFMDITPRNSQEVQVDDNEPVDDHNVGLNKRHKSLTEAPSLEKNYILDETAILGSTTPADYETQESVSTDEFDLMSPMIGKSMLYARNPLVFQYVRGLLRKGPEESFIDITLNPSQELKMSGNKENRKRKLSYGPDEATIAEQYDRLMNIMKSKGMLNANKMNSTRRCSQEFLADSSSSKATKKRERGLNI